MTNPRGRDELSQTLRELRRAAGMTNAQVAAATGFSKAKVSRFESGRFVPTPADAEVIARAVTSSPADVRRVVALATDVREQTAARVVLLRGTGLARKQDEIARIEEQSREISTFANTLVPGLLQTEEYMRVVFRSIGATDEQVDEATASRLARQRQAHASDDRRVYTQVVTEGALTWCVGSSELMLRQLERLIVDARGPLRVGVIPIGRPVEAFPMVAFDVYDTRAAMLGTYTHTAVMTNPGDVAAYRDLFEQMVQLADFGGDAVPTFERLADEYRGLTGG